MHGNHDPNQTAAREYDPLQGMEAADAGSRSLQKTQNPEPSFVGRVTNPPKKGQDDKGKFKQKQCYRSLEPGSFNLCGRKKEPGTHCLRMCQHYCLKFTSLKGCDAFIIIRSRKGKARPRAWLKN